MLKINLYKYRYVIIILALFILFLIIMPHYFFVHDQMTFARWIDWINTGGMVNIYKHDEVNYLPIYLYILEIFGKSFATYQQLFTNLYYLKPISLMFDFGAVVLIYKILGKLKLPKSRILFVVLNIFFFYNTLFWGQIDSIHTFFLFFSFYLIISKKFLTGILAYVLAINIKYQSLIYGPIFLIILLPHFIKNPKSILKYFLISVLLEALILLPYLARGGDLISLFNVLKNSVGFFPYISMNAFNLWFIIVGPGRAWEVDSQTFVVLSYRTWGLILFGIGYLIALIPSIKLVIKKIKTKTLFEWKDINKVLLAFVLTTYSFFFFTTQMHERYIHPAIVFAALWALLNRKYWVYLIMTFCYFANMEKILEFLPLNHEAIFLFSSRFIALLYGAGLVWAYYYLYQEQISGLIKKLFHRNQ